MFHVFKSYTIFLTVKIKSIKQKSKHFEISKVWHSIYQTLFAEYIQVSGTFYWELLNENHRLMKNILQIDSTSIKSLKGFRRVWDQHLSHALNY